MFRRRDRREQVEVPVGTVPPGEEVLPGYRVVALMSHGKRIDTYDVHSQLRDCRCVVKILRADRRDEAETAEKVLLEGRLVTELTHPHLVRGYEVHTDPAPAMVLETLTGRTLEAVITHAGLLSEADTAQLGLQLCSVLGYLHRCGWLHLDVKPANVVIEHGLATLIDLSLVSRPGAGRPGGGTVGYLAPEQVTGQGLSEASDVWGLGITLLECVTGELAYGEEVGAEPGLLRRRRLAPPRPVRGLHPDLDEVLRACVAPDPADRPTLEQVKVVLARFGA